MSNDNMTVWLASEQANGGVWIFRQKPERKANGFFTAESSGTPYCVDLPELTWENSPKMFRLVPEGEVTTHEEAQQIVQREWDMFKRREGKYSRWYAAGMNDAFRKLRDRFNFMAMGYGGTNNVKGLSDPGL